LACRCLQRRWV